MAGFYLKVYQLLPEFLKRRINPLEYQIEAFVHSVDSSPPGAVVLDAGAGESRFAACLPHQLYVAIDSRVGEAGWDYSKIDVCADLTAIPIASNRVDTALNTQVLEHVKDPAAVLEEICRVLKPGGRLYLTAPQGWHEHQQPCDYFRFTRYSLRLLLECAGFRTVSIEPIGGYFHYLGHRLTYIPKIVFQPRRGITRVLLFPLELLSLGLFCLVLPVICYYLDRLDSNKEFTLAYRCLAVK